MNKTLHEQQIDLEIEMAGLGKERFLSRLNKDIEGGRGAQSMPGQYLMKRAIDPVVEGITDYIKDTYNGKPGVKPAAARHIKDMEYGVVAYLAIRAIFNNCMHKGFMPLMTLALKVAADVQYEARFLHFKKENKALFATVTGNLTRGSTEEHNKIVLQYAMNKFDIPWDSWSHTEKIGLGIKLIELVSERTGYFSINKGVTRSVKNESQYIVNMTDTLKDWLSQAGDRAEGLFPSYMPMVITPKKWDNLHGCGYISNVIRPVNFVRHRNNATAKQQNTLLKKAHLGAVYGGVNSIQETKWVINKDVLAVFQTLLENGSELCGLVSNEDVSLPPRPHDIDTNAKALQEWKWKARDTHELNLKNRAESLRQTAILEMAQKFSTYDEVYFPHSVDFRGRVYPISSTLHPQGADQVKGLLHFAEGRPLGPRGRHWLAVHGANVFGEDKVSFEERVQWVEKNSSRIIDCASDPLTELWWTEADKPWCFLAFCFEWLGQVSKGEKHVSHIPIAMDGSCNGLQHFSAMLLDEVGGTAVNLVPSDKPQDIYQRVADEAMRRLEQISQDENEEEQKQRWAYAWVSFGLNRKITKRPVMVLPYGGTPRSCLQYVREAVEERFAKGEINNFGDELNGAIGFLSSIIWDSIGNVVIAAREAMVWLQKVARVVSKKELPLVWTTPSGFVVQQAYKNLKKRRIFTQLSGSLLQLISYEEQDKLDKSKQATSISPNFVHSLDAAAMILTVDKLAGHGYRSFAMIHDSYGVHACDTDQLNYTLRETFVEIYKTDPLTRFRDELVERHPEIKDDIPPLPKKGKLDLDQVMDSDFFFA